MRTRRASPCNGISSTSSGKVKNLSDTPMSETRRLLVAGWAQSATNPNPSVFEGDEHKAMGMASLLLNPRPWEMK